MGSTRQVTSLLRSRGDVDKKAKAHTLACLTAIWRLNPMVYECARRACSSLEVVLDSTTEPKLDITANLPDGSTALDCYPLDPKTIESDLYLYYLEGQGHIIEGQTYGNDHQARPDWGVKTPFSTSLSLETLVPTKVRYRIEFRYQQ